MRTNLSGGRVNSLVYCGILRQKPKKKNHTPKDDSHTIVEKKLTSRSIFDLKIAFRLSPVHTRKPRRDDLQCVSIISPRF